MSTSKRSDSEVPDWAPPWRIERPSRAKPLPGPALDAWLEQRLLFRSGSALRCVLDRINPAIARNEPVGELVEDVVMTGVLELLESPLQVLGGAQAEPGRLSQSAARAFLAYFVRGFRRYCQTHHLRMPRLPLIRELSLDDGLLNAESVSVLDEYRRAVRALSASIEALLDEPSTLSPTEITALIVGSAAVFGGLPREAQWRSLASTLVRAPSTDGTLLWFLLDKPTPLRWIADPVTEALIRRLWTANLLPLSQHADVTGRTLHAVLRMDGNSASTATRLEAAVRAAHVRHFAPDVAGVAQGLIRNTPMPEEPWLRLISGTRHPSPRARIALSVPRTHRRAAPETIEQVRLSEMIDRIGAAVSWNPAAERAASQAPRGTTSARYVSRATNELSRCEQALCDLFSRAGAPGGHLRTYAYGLLSYARDLLFVGGQKRKELAPSTVANYVSIAKGHLQALWFEDLVALPTELREEVYRSEVRAQAIRGRNAYRTAFEGFERSLLRHLEIADEVDWGTIQGRARQRELPPADANLIDSVLYRHVFESLGAASAVDPLLAMSRTLLLVLYRFGLRTGEAAELTVGSVLLHANGTASLRVLSSRLTTRKSTNAIRTVGPIPLPSDEFTALREYRQWRDSAASGRERERSATYLFSTPGTERLDLVLSAQETLVDVLREVAGDSNLRARHFRHSFVSRLYVAGREGLGRRHIDAPRVPIDQWQRAYLVGHAAPDTSIVSYTHTNELAHYHYACQAVGQEASPALLSRLLGNESRSLERATLRAGDGVGVIEVYLHSLRRRFPCADQPNALSHRISYPALEVGPRTVMPATPGHRLDWRSAWGIYAQARIGQASEDMSEHAVAIQARVRALTNTGHVRQRTQRRPQLTTAEEAAAAHLWQGLADDTALRNLINAAAEAIRPGADRLGLPAEVAAELAHRLSVAGLHGIRTEPGSRHRRWVVCQSGDRARSRTWVELLAFLHCGFAT